MAVAAPSGLLISAYAGFSAGPLRFQLLTARSLCLLPSALLYVFLCMHFVPQYFSITEGPVSKLQIAASGTLMHSPCPPFYLPQLAFP